MNPGTETELNNLIKSVNFTISSLDLTPSTVTLHGELDSAKDLRQIDREISDNLKLLRIKAIAGDAEAITVIHRAGTQAALILEELGREPKDHQSKIDAFPPQHVTPSVTFLNDNKMSEVLDLIEKNKLFIESIDSKFIYEKMRETNDYDYEFQLECPSVLSAHMENHRLSAFCSLVHGALRVHTMGFLRKSTMEAVSRLAFQSYHWPIAADPWTETQRLIPQQLKELKLGKELPFAFERLSQRGKSRDFGERSKTLFVLSLYAHVEELLNSFPPRSADEEKDLIKVDKWTRSVRAGIKPSPGCEPSNYIVNIGAVEIDWRVEPCWKLKTLLLPAFPKKLQTAAIEKWTEVFRLLTAQICEDDWDGYPWWPSSVYERGQYDEKAARDRTKRQAVYELIDEGINNLMKID